MRLPSQFYTLNDRTGVAEGPWTLVQLKKQKQLGILTPASKIAPSADLQWQRIDTQPQIFNLLFPNGHSAFPSATAPDAQPKVSPQVRDVKELLQLNRRFEDPDTLIPALQKEDALQPRRMSRKMRDFLMLFIGGNLLFSAVAFFFAINLMTIGASLAFFLFYGAGLSYLLFVVMDRY